MEWFVYGTGLFHWHCHVHEFNKWVFIQQWYHTLLWFSIVKTQLHFICLTGNFAEGSRLVKLGCKMGRCAWKRLKTTALKEHLRQQLQMRSKTFRTLTTVGYLRKKLRALPAWLQISIFSIVQFKCVIRRHTRQWPPLEFIQVLNWAKLRI